MTKFYFFLVRWFIQLESLFNVLSIYTGYWKNLCVIRAIAASKIPTDEKVKMMNEWKNG